MCKFYAMNMNILDSMVLLKLQLEWIELWLVFRMRRDHGAYLAKARKTAEHQTEPIWVIAILLTGKFTLPWQY